MLTDQTIAAISTGLVDSGISIIRISGKNSLKIINKMFSNAKKLKPNTIIFGSIKDTKGDILDKCLVSYFKAPNSYTGEDICEINCHGGKQITLEILDEVLKNGAIMAQPGEFSKRAFFNGKIDLSQSEAIMNLIESKSKVESKIAINQLEGNLSKKISEIKNKLVEIMAQIEVSIDYPEYEYEELKGKKLKDILNIECNQIQKMIDSYEEGKIIKSGVNSVILGMPNVGKSSLFNLLANYERAIVTDVPGTTRDIVDETVNIGGLILNFSDTAGIRKTDDLVEKIGVERSIKKLEEVDLVIYMICADSKISDIDIEMLSKIKSKKLNLIVVINKMDKLKKDVFNSNLEKLKKIDITDIVDISVKDGSGIDKLKSKVVEIFKINDYDYNKDYIIVNKRHKDLLVKSYQILKNCIDEIDKDSSIDIITIPLRQAIIYLDQIIGTDVSIDLVNKIFEKFCLGK